MRGGTIGTDRGLRIGNCSGFFGDRLSAAVEMVEHGELDVLTGDWLAELTMSILHKQRLRDRSKGYASTLLTQLEQVLGRCVDENIRIVSNAGGLNPPACATAVSELCHRLGITASVGFVEGDNVSGELAGWASEGRVVDAAHGGLMDLAGEVVAANAYLGAWEVVRCLDAGANVVVTGRITDASLVVAPAAWRFKWSADDWGPLAGAVVAGHVIECGGQATGGNFSFFHEIDDYRRIGFPIAEVFSDGSSVISKPSETGGAVTVDTVTAQLMYEIQTDEYLNPDVTVDLATVSLAQVGEDQVSISPVTGRPPTDTFKVGVVQPAGFRNDMTLVLTGDELSAKAAIAEDAVWSLLPGGRDAFEEVCVELLGGGAIDAPTQQLATAFLRIAVRDHDELLVGRKFPTAVIESGLCSYPGLMTTTPPTKASACYDFAPVLVPKVLLRPRASVDSRVLPPVEVLKHAVPVPKAAEREPDGILEDNYGPFALQRLGDVLGARSGDKGGDANLGLWARTDQAARWLESEVTDDLIRSLLPDNSLDRIERYSLPNLRAVNFVLRGFLGTGVSSCLRLDAQAKGLAEYVRSRHVPIPQSLLEEQ